MPTDGSTSGSILIVEDEALVRVFAVDVLEDAGFNVAQAGTAAEALSTLHGGIDRILAVLVDIGLPDRSGDELATEMHALRADLPIVITSGRSERELRERFAHGDPGSSRNRRPIAVLGKPYTASTLLAALQSLGVTSPRQ